MSDVALHPTALDRADDPAAAEPAAGELVAADPAADELVAAEPAAGDPAAADPAAGELVAKDPAADELVAKDPAADELVAKDPAANSPAAGELAAAEPAVNSPAAGELAAAEPAVNSPAAGELAAAEPAVNSPAAGEPVAHDPAAPSLSRRRFLGAGLVLVAGVAGATVLSRLVPIFEDEAATPAPIVPAYDPTTRAWTFVVDTSRCIGCGLCVAACKTENHVPEEPTYNRTWVERHAVAQDGTMYVDSPDAGIHGFPPDSTAPGATGQPIETAYFVPRLCMQCENSPCTAVCPVSATYRTPDGVILVDAERCIGCGYCVVACPYGARYIVPAGEPTPQGTPGIADKCTWCYHRLARGLLPTCVEVCPVGARKFGDRNDPDSDVAKIVRDRHPEMLWPEYGTRPRVLYLGPVTEEA